MTVVQLMLRLERIPASRWDMLVTISTQDGETVSDDIFNGPFRLDFNEAYWSPVAAPMPVAPMLEATA